MNKETTTLQCAVIIYHKNVGNYNPLWISECVTSIQNQTLKNFDVFELDYGGGNTQIYPDSNFASMALADHALAHNFLLDKVFKLGYDCAFNVNVDDHYSHHRFVRQLEFIKEGYDVVSSNYYNIDGSSKVIDTIILHNKNMRAEAAFGHNIIAHPVCCYSKKFWTTCTKLDPAQIPVDDFELWKRSFDKYKFVILEDYLLYYRIHPKKASHPTTDPKKPFFGPGDGWSGDKKGGPKYTPEEEEEINKRRIEWLKTNK